VNGNYLVIWIRRNDHSVRGILEGNHSKEDADDLVVLRNQEFPQEFAFAVSKPPVEARPKKPAPAMPF